MDDFKRKPVNRLDQPEGWPTSPAAHRSSLPHREPSVPSAATTQAPIHQLPPTPPQPREQLEPPVIPQPIETPPLGQPAPKKKLGKRKRLIILISSIFLIVAGLTLGGILIWYQSQLAPVDSNDSAKVLVTIKSGSTPSVIAATLKEDNLIRSETAFLWYTRFNDTQDSLQAGTYRLSPSESTQQIVEHLTKGTVDTFDITFLPGATLEQNRKVFVEAGYSEDEIDAAFKVAYDSPLFQDKPASADLEGYIYGDTYKFGSGATVQEILEHVFENFYAVIEENKLVASFATQKLTLYEGITLASIIQRESIGGDEAQIAQVFYSRLAIDMPLGSDVTYQYIADKLGVDRDPNLDSPYNTRRYTGLPPGPIATPGLASLKAVASPAAGDYLYFLSGDDDITYFGRTLEEHEANIVNHCKEKCQII